MTEHPRISIITVTLNAAMAFPETMHSILEQDYPDLEWIVVDGGSVDGTVEQIRSATSRISRWISEPDHGLYDAMNKGIRMATGEWINFMNAGDTFVSPSTITEVFSNYPDEADVVYGGCLIRYPAFWVRRKAGLPEKLTHGMQVCHQSVFIRTNLAQSHSFNVKYRIGADYQQIASLFHENVKFRRLDIPIAVYDIGGDSNRKMVASAREHYLIARSVFKLSAGAHLFHMFFIAKVSLISLAYMLLPSRWAESVRNSLVAGSAYNKKPA